MLKSMGVIGCRCCYYIILNVVGSLFLSGWRSETTVKKSSPTGVIPFFIFPKEILPTIGRISLVITPGGISPLCKENLI